LDKLRRLFHGWEQTRYVEVNSPNENFVGAQFGGDVLKLLKFFVDFDINMVKHKRSDSFLALIDGKPVGGASMESTPEIACLFGTSVVPTFRRRGIQSILMILRMERARERGSRLVAIHSNPGISTERNAMRLGFFLAYTKCVMTMPREGLLASP